MYNVKDYLTPIYNESSKFIGLLEYFGAHISLSDICKELEHSFKYSDALNEEKNFDLIFTKIYEELTQNILHCSRVNRLKNIYYINKKQYSRLKARNFKIRYPVVDHLNQYSEDNTLLYKKSLSLQPNIFPDIKTRTLILYHRSYASDYLDNELKFGVDIFQLIIIYKTVYQLIVDNKTTLFNNIQIVSRYNNLPDITFKILNKCILPHNASFFYKSKELEFIQRTSVYTNTFHFFGGELPDSSMFTTPIVTYAHSLQNNFMSVVKNKHVIPFFYFPGTISNLGELIPQEDADYLVDNKLVTSKDLAKSVGDRFRNNTIYNIIQETINCVLSLEKRMIEDEIYD